MGECDLVDHGAAIRLEVRGLPDATAAVIVNSCENWPQRKIISGESWLSTRNITTSIDPTSRGTRTPLHEPGQVIEEISRLVGHSSPNVTETVYRHQIRPVITVGAEAMDKIYANEK